MIIRPARSEMLTVGPTPEESDLISGHFHYWKAQVASGSALVVGRTQTSDANTLGLAIFRAEGEAAARRIVDEDPAVQMGVFRAEVFPYRVALLGDPGPFRPAS